MKALLGRLWRITWPLRRPFAERSARRQRELMVSVLRDQVQPHLEANTAAIAGLAGMGGHVAALEQALNLARCHADAHAVDANLVLDSLVREVARLQRVIEELHQVVEDASSTGSLDVVGEDSESPARMLAG